MDMKKMLIISIIPLSLITLGMMKLFYDNYVRDRQIKIMVEYVIYQEADNKIE